VTAENELADNESLHKPR